MKRALQLLGFILLFCAFHSAHAQNCALGANPTMVAVNTALGYAHNLSCTGTASNNLVTGSGTTAVGTSTITIPCNASVSGPINTYSQTPNQTWTFTGSSSNTGWLFATTAGCPQVNGKNAYLQWVETNGMQPTDGGGGLHVVAGTTNFDVLNNWFHGVNSPGETYTVPATSDLIYFDGGQSSATTNNMNILYNIFGSTVFSDCATAMNDTSGNEDNNGGGCGGIGVHTNANNIIIRYNIFHYLEQPMKWYESQGTCNPDYIEFNDYSNYTRIGFETQCSLIPNSGNVLMYIRYNDWHNRYGHGVQTYDLSAANGCKTPDETGCITHDDYNVDISNDTASGAQADVGFEIWGGTGTTASGNLFEGNLANAITWSQNANFNLNNNDFNLTSGGSTSCQPHPSGGYWNYESGNVTSGYLPTCTGNTYASGGTGTYTSASPTFSITGGSVTYGTVITLGNSGTKTRDQNNTSIWCTTDGSIPSVGSGTATIMTSYTVTGYVTLKCLGMWGAINQPYSYGASYGYVPSAVVGQSYTTGGSPVQAATPVISPASSTFVGSRIVSITDSTPSSTIYYTTNGTTPTTSSTVYTGQFSINATTTVQAIATAPGYLTSVIASATYTLTSTPTLQSVTISLTGGGTTIPLSGTVQAIASCTFSNGSVITSPNTGCVPTAWNSNATPVASANSTGVYTGNSSGPANIWAVVGGITGQALSITVTGASLTGVAITGSSVVNINSIDTLGAMCTFSDGSTSICTSNITSWTSSATTIATVSTTGSVTGLVAGYTNIVATYNGISSPNFQVQVVSQSGNTQLMGLQLRGLVYR
jgi:hypothetical protein